MTCRITFTDGSHPPIDVEPGESLMDVCDRMGAPILFNCRAGACGTCLIEIEGPVSPPPEALEAATLAAVAPTSPKLRLACQLRVTGSWKLKYAAGF